jgi:hypothetical protein
MGKRISAMSKLTPEVRKRLAELAAEARQLVYGEQGCPKWGTSFAEIEADANEVGHEFIRLVLEQTGSEQVGILPEDALTTASGETAQRIGSRQRDVETESGLVSWAEPKAYLPKSRKAFFPSVEGLGPGS